MNLKAGIKKILYLIILLLLIFPKQVNAHAIGQPPFLKVNKIFTDYYNVPSTSLTDFILPQDIAVGSTFLVNQPIEFEIEPTALPVPPETIEKTKFLWNFADGSTATGLKVTHIFTKPGTYFVMTKTDSGEGFEPQLLQSTAINILPAQEYQLPKAVIEINGKQAEDPLLDVIEADFSKDFNFDASKSLSGSSQIISYEWDAGDFNSKNGKSFRYKYQTNPYTVFPVLRIRTADGFISDTFIQLSENPSIEPINSQGTNTKSNKITFSIIVLIVVCSVFILVWYILRKRRVKNRF